MAYSVDLRERVVNYIAEGNSKAKAARTFRVGRSTIYDWLKRESLTPDKPGPTKPWKLCPDALQAHVIESPDAYQHERGAELGVSRHVVLYGLKRLKITRKKNDNLSGERRHTS